MHPIVEADNLCVRYGDKEALQGACFSVSSGEVLGIIGPNGSGKTTTLSCIEGLLVPSSGSVRVFSADPRRDRQKVLPRMGVQLQDASYPLRIRVGELCALFASFYRTPADWRVLLDGLGLRSFEHRRVQSLSGGERQKLSILLALIGQPELLILDEISTGLAPEARQAVRSSLRQIADAGIAMILVTHYIDELEGLADKLLLLDGGRQRFWGAAADFRHWVETETGSSNAGQSLAQVYLSVCPPAATLQLRGAA